MSIEFERHVGVIATALFEAIPAASIKLCEAKSMLRAICGAKYSDSPTRFIKRAFGWCIEGRTSVVIAGSEHRAEWLFEIGGGGDALRVSSSASITDGDTRFRLGDWPARSLDELRSALDAAVAALAGTVGAESPFRAAIERTRGPAPEKHEPQMWPTNRVLHEYEAAWLAPFHLDADARFGPSPRVEPRIEASAIAEAVSAIDSFAKACERLDDFARGLGAPDDVRSRCAVPRFDRSFEEKPDERHLEKQIALNIHADEGQVAGWGLSLGWSDGRWAVGSHQDICYSDFYEDDERQPGTAAELEQVLNEVVDELIATAQAGSKLSNTIEDLRAQARQASSRQ